jgi:Flp pilus assembly protein TadG
VLAAIASLWTREEQAGIATTELALALPLLLVCIAGLANVGHRIAVTSQVESAASAGARRAARSGFDQSKIALAIEQFRPDSGIVASPTPTEACRCKQQNQYSNIVGCSSKCTDGSDPARYAVVSASLSYNEPFSFISFSNDKSVSIQRWTRLK